MRKLIVLFLFAAGCQSYPTAQSCPLSPYHVDGRAKPRIALFPIFDRSTPEARVTWNLAEELTSTLCQLIHRSDTLYLTPLLPSAAYLPTQNPPLHPKWMENHRNDAEFLVILELLNHDCDRKQVTRNLFSAPNQLHMAVRVEVIDMRRKAAKPILREIVRKESSLNFEALQIAYEAEGFGNYLYSLSPIGLAHRALIEEIKSHVEEYILLAKTHG